MNRTRPTFVPRKLSIALSLAALAACLLAASPAQATFPGKPGAIVYPKSSFSESSSDGGGLFAHGPKRSQKPHQLTTDPDDSSPSVSADGRSIVFSSNRDPSPTAGGSHIYVADADGSGVTQVTADSTFDSNPSFSPDGEQIVFDRRVGSGKSRIYVVGVDGAGLKALTDSSSSAWEPVFTPNGRRIVYTSNADVDAETDRSDIFAMAPNGDNQKVLIDGIRNESEPDVSPNGKAIVFSSNRFHESNIWVARANGSHVRKVTHNKGDCFRGTCFVSPAWAPDGKHIAALGLGRYKSVLEIMKPDGSISAEFDSGGTEEEGYGSHVGAPAWGPVPK
jgi:dipeptidyl aminopeptidase/acylaminoacyl peptidase